MKPKKTSETLKIPAFAQAAEAARRLDAPGGVVLTHAGGGAVAKFLADFRQAWSGNVWVVAAEPEEAENLVADVRLWTAAAAGLPADDATPPGGGDGYYLPAWDLLPNENEHLDLDIAQGQINALRALAPGVLAAGRENSAGRTASRFLTLPVTALLQPVLAPDALETGKLIIHAGLEISPVTLTARLQAAGFTHEEVVEAPGQFARRGGIVDVFPFFAESPLRVEFFGDEIDTMRFFDSVTQTSDKPTTEKVTVIDINRDSFARAYAQNRCPLSRYLTPDTAVVLLAPEKLADNAAMYYSGYISDNPLFTWEKMAAALTGQPLIVVPEFADCEIPLLRESCGERGMELPETLETLDLACGGLTRLAENIEVAAGEFSRWHAENIAISVFCRNPAERQRLRELLAAKIDFLPEISFPLGTLTQGFYAPELRRAVTTDQEILGRTPLRRTPRKRRSSPLAAFTDLTPGDYVVHLAHGIARYEGLENITSNGTQQDFLRLRFAEEACLYVPLSHIELVQRYIGGGNGSPPLSKLGGGNWQRKKNAAAAAARDIAQDLLRLQAARRSLAGVAMRPDGALQREFDASFPYQETPDQLAAIQDIKNDQQQTVPMDRLLCGDVGFGKTEVAMRAAFKAVENGMQVAVLVPTTILAEQHCRTFKERMADYPVTIAGISRFTDDGRVRDTLTALREGKLDIIIGTHRLLSKDVQFKNLGLVVVDEEQRFGVEQKERLKQMRVCVDVLTMTATPIPRTLNLAMLGLRDISNLTTAPTERQAIRTEVVRYSDELIRRVILRELARGGQVYFLHNRVRTINQIADKLIKLVPEARFTVAHGQMDEHRLYESMESFLNRKSDVLVCTTIIETGVDIPTVNTLIVHEAEHFGLGQLHQLRGRVGRYKHKAYAYFLLPERRPANPDAQKRLRALEEYSELGAGFRLAMRDLEIRGTGNILGAEQSGHINVVGFELYCRLLEKSVAELRGEKTEETEPVELDLGNMAYIDAGYISAENQRIDFYRRLNNAADEAELADLQAYLRDRYGPVPPETEDLFADQKLRIHARGVKINYFGRLEDALVVGFSAQAGNDEIAKLQFCGRKVTPFEDKRWRVGLLDGEDYYDAAWKMVDALHADIERVMAGLSARRQETSRPAENSPRPDATAADEEDEETPSIRPAVPLTRERARYMELAAGLERNSVARPAAPAKRDSGARIFAVEGDPGLGTVKLTVNDADFDTRAFGPVTIVIGTERWFLRLTGSASEGTELAVLTLRADTPEQVTAIIAAFTADKNARVFKGIREEENDG